MSCSVEDLRWMSLALEEARLAMQEGEVPVGAVIVRNGLLLSRAHNLCERETDATAHAECLAIGQACRKASSWRLSDCTLYVTLEPCPMCAGAAVNARVGRIVYAAKDPRAGALGSLLICDPILLREGRLSSRDRWRVSRLHFCVPSLPKDAKKRRAFADFFALSSLQKR